MQKAAIWVENWELECCGNAFKTGDAVSWIVSECKTVYPDIVPCKVDYYYNNHARADEITYKLDGTVSEIEAIYALYQQVERTLIPIAYKLVPFEDEAYGQRLDSINEYKFCGYLVHIIN